MTEFEKRSLVSAINATQSLVRDLINAVCPKHERARYLEIMIVTSVFDIMELRGAQLTEDDVEDGRAALDTMLNTIERRYCEARN